MKSDEMNRLVRRMEQIREELEETPGRLKRRILADEYQRLSDVLIRESQPETVTAK